MAKKQANRPKTAETRQQGRQTMARVLNHALIELNKRGVAKFDLEAVLKRSKTSKGSLYHHFGSKNGLLVAVEAEQIKSGLNRDNQVLRQMIESCKTTAEFYAAIEIAIRTGVGESTREVRRQLIRSITFAQHNTALAEMLRETGISGTKFLAETLEIAQHRGWLIKDVDTMAFAFWLQGLFIGQIMIDITGIKTLDEEWIEIVMQSIKTFIVF